MNTLKCLRQAQCQQRCPCGSTVSYTSRVYDAFFYYYFRIDCDAYVASGLFSWKGSKQLQYNSVLREVSESWVFNSSILLFKDLHWSQDSTKNLYFVSFKYLSLLLGQLFKWCDCHSMAKTLHYLKEPQQNKKRNFVLSFHSITYINYQTAFKGITREKKVEKRNNVSGVRYSARYFTCIISLSPHSNLTR